MSRLLRFTAAMLLMLAGVATARPAEAGKTEDTLVFSLREPIDNLSSYFQQPQRQPDHHAAAVRQSAVPRSEERRVPAAAGASLALAERHHARIRHPPGDQMA